MSAAAVAAVYHSAPADLSVLHHHKRRIERTATFQRNVHREEHLASISPMLADLYKARKVLGSLQAWISTNQDVLALSNGSKLLELKGLLTTAEGFLWEAVEKLDVADCTRCPPMPTLDATNSQMLAIEVRMLLSEQTRILRAIITKVEFDLERDAETPPPPKTPKTPHEGSRRGQGLSAVPHSQSNNRSSRRRAGMPKRAIEQAYLAITQMATAVRNELHMAPIAAQRVAAKATGHETRMEDLRASVNQVLAQPRHTQSFGPPRSMSFAAPEAEEEAAGEGPEAGEAGESGGEGERGEAVASRTVSVRGLALQPPSRRHSNAHELDPNAAPDGPEEEEEEEEAAAGAPAAAKKKKRRQPKIIPVRFGGRFVSGARLLANGGKLPDWMKIEPPKQPRPRPAPLEPAPSAAPQKSPRASIAPDSLAPLQLASPRRPPRSLPAPLPAPPPPPMAPPPLPPPPAGRVPAALRQSIPAYNLVPGAEQAAHQPVVPSWVTPRGPQYQRALGVPPPRGAAHAPVVLFGGPLAVSNGLNSPHKGAGTHFPPIVRPRPTYV